MADCSKYAESPIAVVGLGLLGTAIAERLLQAGFELVVNDLHREKADPLERRGAQWSNDPLAECERAILCLYCSNDTQQFLEEHTDRLSVGQLLIDVATTPPDHAARLGVELLARGVDYLESPFVASSDQTRRGQGVALVAGSQGVFLACDDLYDAMAPTRYFAGDWGCAAKTKLVSNLILGLNRAALAEGLLLAEALQLDMPSTLEVLKGCNSYSGVMDTKGDKMIARDFATQARLSQHAKDVKILIEQMVSRGGRLPFSELHLSVLQFAEEIGLGALDNSAIIEAIARFGIDNSGARQ